MRRVSLIVCSLMLVSSVASAQRADARPRPWPDDWPIELPPVRGPLPPEPPPRYVAPATPAATRVLEEIGSLRQGMTETSYQHRLTVNRHRGVYRWDCSLMVEWILERAAPQTVRHLAADRRPLAEHFVRLIERAPTDRYRRGWQRIEDIRSVRPGDVFAWRRPRGFPSRNTGHVGFVVGAPRPVPGIPGAYAVQVADATRSAHQNDTRPWPGDGGFGIGTLVFLTDGDGHGTHYGWGGTYSSGYVVTPILFGRIGG